jgi:hypothetical protein
MSPLWQWVRILPIAVEFVRTVAGGCWPGPREHCGRCRVEMFPKADQYTEGSCFLREESRSIS